MIATTVDESGTRRAVTKLVDGDRLVSCTCCTSEACCLYDANTLYETEFLQYEDLPETWNEGEFTKLDPPLTAPQMGDNPDGWFDGFTAYYTDPNFVFGNMGYIGIYDSTDTLYSSAIDFAPVALGTCLNDFLTDDFPDTLGMSGGGFELTVYRTGPCRWEFTDNNYPYGIGGITGTVSGLIVFHGDNPNDTDKWQRFEASIGYNFPDAQDGGAFGGFKEFNDNSTPLYNYVFNNSVVITVF